MSKDGTTWQYTYDVNGMRMQRTNGSSTYKYVYNGSQLSQMTVGNNTLSFAYDATGAPVVLVWNGVPYYYVTTLQGDVLIIMDLDGEVVVSYEYDAWGNILGTTGSLASTLGTLNPLRYRGYVYDEETGLYYLQSRYYNPEWGRFLNADAYVTTDGLLGNNMFAYCLNNPVNFCDSFGYYTDGQIHDFVIEEIVNNSRALGRKLKYRRWDTLIVYDHLWRGKLYGYCDIFDPSSGEMWEVKKQSWSYTCSTGYATKQLENYISNGYLVSDIKLKRKLPDSTLVVGKEQFTKTDLFGNEYKISYWEEGNGIIRYSYVVKPPQKVPQVVLTTLAIGGLIGIMAVCMMEDQSTITFPWLK